MGSLDNPLHEAVLESLPCEVIAHDKDTVVLANNAAGRLFGAPSPRSLIGMPLSALVIPGDREEGARRRARLFGEDLRFDGVRVRLVRLCGEPVELDVTARSFTIGSRHFAYVTRTLCCDSSNVAPADAPLAFAEGTPLARAVLDSLPMAVTAYDANDRIVYANTRAADVFGAAGPDDLTGSPLSVVIHPHAAEAARARRHLVLTNGQTFSGVEAKLRTVQGDVFRAVGSLGSARMPDGQSVGYWMAHSVTEPQPAVD